MNINIDIDRKLFNTNGYVIVRRVLNEQTLNLLKTEIKITEKTQCFKNLKVTIKENGQ